MLSVHHYGTLLNKRMRELKKATLPGRCAVHLFVYPAACTLHGRDLKIISGVTSVAAFYLFCS